MTERDAIYVEILGYGLLRVRESAASGDLRSCGIESEHLHNVPSLVGETNEARHDYYFNRERAQYLEQVDRSLPGMDFILRRYAELWTRLRPLNKSAIP